LANLMYARGSGKDSMGGSNAVGAVLVKRGFPRPSRGFVPFATAVVILFAWGGVAHQSGSGWVQAMGVVIGGYAFTGLFVPALACWRLRVQPVGIPEDVIAGDEYIVDLRTNYYAHAVLLEVDRPGGSSGEDAGRASYTGIHFSGQAEEASHAAGMHSGESWRVSGTGTAAPSRMDGMARREAATVGLHASCKLTSLRRGLVDKLDFDVATAWPLGILWWHKNVTFILERPIHVAPRRGEPIDPGFFGGSTNGGLHRTAGRSGSYTEYQRGVRQYVPGDLQRDMHWPASAHAGQLMAREREMQHGQPVLLDVRLPYDVDEADLLAERLMGSVDQIVRSGRELVMITLEKGGRIRHSVRDTASAGRRLARAMPEPGDSSSVPELGSSRAV
ncbi:MAG: DUF58 domain-containing protein, partial [Acidimicrobiales bacterium]